MSRINRSIDFMAKRKIAGMLSIILVTLSLVSLAVNQLKLGLDFTGGTLVEVAFEKAPELNLLRNQLESAGFSDVTVQSFGTDRDVLVRLGQGFSPTVGDDVLQAIRQNTESGVELKRAEFVGAQVGEELRDQGGIGMLLALALVMLYVAFRFQFKFSVASVVALAHDVIIMLGMFSIFQLDFDLTVLAAVLAVIGYSLNDTIVVFDRVRENFRRLRTGDAIEIVNVSLNQTLGRTLITSLTTILVLLALFFFGGELIHNFAVALLVGVIVGTYSSIYVAANILLLMKIDREDLMLPEKEGEVMDDRP
ncbi:protein translocase subunit secF [Oceanospirillum multiglobuliferum]|uniref:Protein-export membrane protein SecF n=1 Tax=Oceanospirillum multiglobuliferum TaxID=64969 RepID=A0A1T4M1P6_9GAMM|nr:protein translocase subunit SecF [Oceanospirillum multiglobuliferum]OPX56277.1 protein-export membrane protein SecF [Oceanospirillum multiglobuliferum]SJZ60883.1 protein translocase subunit secF [Oceanospirillum multiglobuliferum]